jgi:ribosomal protein S18 acetylase RimI-like enzyme
MVIEGFAIEEVTDLDAAFPDLRDLFLAFEEYNVSFMPERRLRDDWEERWRKLLALNEDRLVLIARVRGEAVGYIVVGVSRDFGLTRDEFAYIGAAFVRQEFRSRRVGQSLLRRAEAWVKQRGLDEVRLDVWAANKPAVRFWTLSGFGLQSMTMRKSLTGARQ